MERLQMMIAMQLMGMTMSKGRAATPAEIDSFVAAAKMALEKCYAVWPQVDDLERKADAARAGRPR